MLKDSKYFKIWYEKVKLKPSTRYGYACRLTHFETYLAEQGLTEEENLDFERFFVDEQGRFWPINSDFIVDYVEWLSEELESTPTAAQNAYVALKSLFKTLVAAGVITNDPTEGVHGPAYHLSRKNDRLTREEAQAMIRAAEKADPFWKRSLLLVYLFLFCGLRGGEIRLLAIDQIDFINQIIRVERGQRTGPGVVAMPGLVVEALSHYIQHPKFAEMVTMEPSEPLLRNRDGTPLKYHQLCKGVRELAKDAGIDRRISPHMLRHTYASLACEAGLDLKMIQDQLRHKDPATTLLYINPSKESDMEILNNSPMAAMLGTFTLM